MNICTTIQWIKSTLILIKKNITCAYIILMLDNISIPGASTVAMSEAVSNLKFLTFQSVC